MYHLCYISVSENTIWLCRLCSIAHAYKQDGTGRTAGSCQAMESGQSQKLKNGQRKTSVTQLRKALKVVTLPNSQLIDLHIAHAYNVYNYVRMDCIIAS